MGRLRVWMFVVGTFTVLLVIFGLVEWAQFPLLVDPSPALEPASVLTASIGVALLVADSVVPVPSSIVMVALGASFGLAGGVVLSVVGSVGGFAIGFAIGRGSRRSVGEAMDPADQQRAVELVRRWGVLAVVASRPLPLVAETVALTSGAFGMRPLTAFAGALVGSTVPAVAFAYAGSRGVSTTGGAVVFAVVAVLACACWLASRRVAQGARS